MESPIRPYSSNGGATSRRRLGRGASEKRGASGPGARKPSRGSASGPTPEDVTATAPAVERGRVAKEAGPESGAATAPLPGGIRAPATTVTVESGPFEASGEHGASGSAHGGAHGGADGALGSGSSVEVGGQEAAGGIITINDFEAIFERFQTPLVNFVFRLVGNREQALDLTQDVFVKVYRALSSGTTIQAGALSSWLYRIASNTATDALRRRRLIAWLPLSLFNDDRGIGAGVLGESSGQQSMQGEETITAAAAGAFGPDYDGAVFDQRVADSDLVASVLRKLPTKYAECLLLYEHEGYSCAEIAEILHVSPSAVKMRLMRARERFIELYQKETAYQ